MKNIKYFDILKDAFMLTWKNRFLWFFGFLIFLGSVSANINGKSDGAVSQMVTVQDAPKLFANNPEMTIVFSLVLVLAMIALLVLRILSVAGIIKAVNDINLYRQVSIVAILRQSKRFFWKLLLLELMVGVVLVMIVLVLATPVLYLFALKAKLLAFCALAIAAAIILPLVILAYYLVKYASFYIILAEKKVILSLEAAYVVFAKNVKESLLMGALLVAANFLLLGAIIFVFAVLGIVFVPLGLIAYLIFAKMGAVIFLTIALLIGIMVIVVMISWYMSFLHASWLLFFKQIAFEKHDEKKITDEIAVEAKIPNPEVV